MLKNEINEVAGEIVPIVVPLEYRMINLEATLKEFIEQMKCVPQYMSEMKICYSEMSKKQQETAADLVRVKGDLIGMNKELRSTVTQVQTVATDVNACQLRQEEFISE